MLTKSMKKSRKRKKIDRTEDEDDSYVSSILFHAEKVKVKVNMELYLLSLLFASLFSYFRTTLQWTGHCLSILIDRYRWTEGSPREFGGPGTKE